MGTKTKGKKSPTERELPGSTRMVDGGDNRFSALANEQSDVPPFPIGGIEEA